jgi:hypothetical protein
MMKIRVFIHLFYWCLARSTSFQVIFIGFLVLDPSIALEADEHKIISCYGKIPRLILVMSRSFNQFHHDFRSFAGTIQVHCSVDEYIPEQFEAD